jgi:putative holliday junction resolvase
VRVMAVDPGTKRVGMAVSDPEGIIAQPAGWLPATPAETLVERLAAKARELDVQEMVVGLPRRLDGRLGPEGKAAHELAAKLRQNLRLPVTLVDERLTSVAADRELIAAGERRSRRRELSDQVAAALILQTYLQQRRRG